jgi:flagellar basal-body rod modification protein FlgD
MSTVSSTYTQSSSAAQTPTSSSSATSVGGLAPNEDTFLKLLVTQLQNQDPLNPADSTQFVSQLAQFSSLEQLIQISQNTGKVATAVGSSTQTVQA